LPSLILNGSIDVRKEDVEIQIYLRMLW
jgi:hypothetical protein